MLGRTAGSLYWMFRYLERMENTARLVDTGFHIALTRNDDPSAIWNSILTTAGVKEAFDLTHDEVTQENVVDFLLRDTSQPYSARSMLDNARNNARAARTALTTEIWEAVNSSWIDINDNMRRAIKTRDLPNHVKSILHNSQQIRGALHGTMLRNDIYDFLRLGNFIERLEATARILDVKYYVLLPSIAHVGSSADNVQWETILRSVSAHESYRWLNQGRINASGIAQFLILDKRFPRSMAYCMNQNYSHLCYLAKAYGEETRSLELVHELNDYFDEMTIDRIFSIGLHEFLEDIMSRNWALASQIESDYRFYG